MSENSTIPSLMTLCMDKINDSLHPASITKIEQPFHFDQLEAVQREQDFFNNSVVCGRHSSARFHTHIESMVGFGTKKSFLTRRDLHAKQMINRELPEGVANAIGIINHNGQECVHIRWDDWNDLACYLELAIPVEQIKRLLLKNRTRKNKH